MSHYCESWQNPMSADAVYEGHANMLSCANKIKEQDAADTAYHGSRVY